MPKKSIQSDPMTAEVRKRLEWFILFYKPGFTVEEVESKIYNSCKDVKSASHGYNQWWLDKMIDSWHKLTDDMVQMMQDMRNHSSQKTLGGNTPHQMFVELYGKELPHL